MNGVDRFGLPNEQELASESAYKQAYKQHYTLNAFEIIEIFELYAELYERPVERI